MSGHQHKHPHPATGEKMGHGHAVRHIGPGSVRKARTSGGPKHTHAKRHAPRYHHSGSQAHHGRHHA